MRKMPCIFAIALTLSGHAAAEEQMQTLAAAGDWVALAHRPTLVASIDVCIAYHGPSGLVFRADATALEIRVADQAWSLPANVSGTMAIAVGKAMKAFAITTNTDQMVTVLPTLDDIIFLFDEMDKANFMTVVVGREAPRQISLTGSTRITNAFRACSHLPGNSPGAGSNPFK